MKVKSRLKDWLPWSVGVSHQRVISIILLSIYIVLSVPLYSSASPKAEEWIALTESELEPISLGENEDKIRRALKNNEWSYAAKLLPNAPPPLMFLKGWFYAQAEDWEGALKSLQGLETHPILNDEVNALIAQAELKLNRPLEAERAAALVSRTDIELWHETLRLRGQALRLLKRWDEAHEVYQKLGECDQDFERGISALGLAMVSVERGKLDEGMRLLKNVELTFSGQWVARQAEREANRVLSTSPELSSVWRGRSPAEKILRIEGKLKRGLHQESLSEIQSILNIDTLSDELRCRALIIKGRSLDKSKKRKSALDVLTKAVELCHPQRHPETALALYVAGRAASLIDEEELSDQFFKRLLSDYQHQLSDDAAVFLVRHASERHLTAAGQNPKISSLIANKSLNKKQRTQLKQLAGPRTEALKSMITIAQELIKKQAHGDLASEALTFALIDVLRAGHLDLAQELSDLFEALPPQSFRFHDAGRSLYWQARVKALSGKLKEAKTLYQKAIINAPLSWYALMAYSRLYEINKQEAKTIVTESLTWKPNGLGLPGGEQHRWDWRFRADDPHWTLMKRALMWMRLGLMKRGRRAFRELASYTERPDLQWLSAWALDGYQQYHWSHDILRRKLIEYRHFPPSGFHQKHWQLAYPAPFQDEVLKASQEESVESRFIWGVMREESGYAEKIRSSASAVGLLQLILPTAKMMRESQEPEITIERLGMPEVNIPLGARYLAWVKRNVNCAWSLVPAGYNAGGGALKRWLRDRGHLPLDVFVETIPYEEARWYNKRVVASWITFRTLYGAPKNQFIWPYVSQKTIVESDSPPKKKRSMSKRSAKKNSAKKNSAKKNR